MTAISAVLSDEVCREIYTGRLRSRILYMPYFDYAVCAVCAEIVDKKTTSDLVQYGIVSFK